MKYVLSRETEYSKYLIPNPTSILLYVEKYQIHNVIV